MKIRYDRNQKLKGKLCADFDRDVAFIEEALRNSGDMVKNLFYTEGGSRRAYIAYVDGMTDSQTVQDFIIRPLKEKRSPVPEGMQAEERKGSSRDLDRENNVPGRKQDKEKQEARGTTGDENDCSLELFQWIKYDCLQTIDWTEAEDYEEILTGILSGNSLLLIEGAGKALLLSTRDFPTRGVAETEQEMVIRGPRDSFTENLRTNTALLRRRIRDPRLKMEHTMTGDRSKTDLAICYVDDLVRQDLLYEVKKKLGALSYDGILDAGMLEDMLLAGSQGLTPFPLIQFTERPDKAASGLLEGRIVLVVDNSPGVLILPATFHMFFQTGDDYYTHFLPASFARILRYAASLFAIGFPGLYVAILSFHTEMMAAGLLLPIALARTGIAIPVIGEVLLMELQFELLREAGIHIPGPLGSTIGIVGGLIVGQAAVDAGLVSNIVVIVVAFTAMASFVVPNEDLSSAFRLLKFFFIIMAALWGIYGYLLAFAALLYHLSQLESFGIPYLYPSARSKEEDSGAGKDLYMRFPFSRMVKRPVFTRPGQRIRMRKQGD